MLTTRKRNVIVIVKAANGVCYTINATTNFTLMDKILEPMKIKANTTAKRKHRKELRAGKEVFIDTVNAGEYVIVRSFQL